MKEEFNNEIEESRIEYLPFPQCIRKRVGMYLSGTDKAAVSTCLREIVDNATDEVAEGYGNTVFVSNNYNGYNFVADNGRGIPLRMSTEKPDKTEAYLSISELHSSGKFKTGEIGRVGVFGIGSSAISATSSIYCLIIRVHEGNWMGSIPEVERAWKNRSRGDVYYIVICERGEKVYEDCLRLKDIEKILFKGIPDYKPIPKGFSTLVFFKPDPEIFEETQETDIPLINLNYFLLIQQRFFGRKDIQVLVNGEPLVLQYNPFKFEIAKKIIPKDPNSPNKEVGIYLTFEVDPELKRSNSDFASVNGLDCRMGYHINLTKNLFRAAIKDVFKVSHEYILEGIKSGIVVLANEAVYSSQTKENLKSLAKVKADDFVPIVKEIEKIFKKNMDYWQSYIDKVNAFYDARRTIGAVEKAQRMIDSASGSSFYRSKSGLAKGFSDATCSDRSKCSLFICEGDSPAGSLKSGRRSVGGSLLEGIIAIKGKILNVSDVDIDRALENKEISTIFSVIGVGIQEKNVTTGCASWEEAHEKLMKYSRFSKICIACDADSDGSQITMLLLYLFSKYARFLIDHGMVYISVSPLFEQNKVFYYPGDPVDSNGVPIGINQSKPFRRFKGLGSIPKDMVYDIFFNPKTRRLIQVTPEGIDYAMSLTEDIKVRKDLLIKSGILSNPFNLKD